MAAIHITDIEAAINHWRSRVPSPDGVSLAPEIRALAEVYAQMVFRREDVVEQMAIQGVSGVVPYQACQASRASGGRRSSSTTSSRRNTICA